MFLETALLLPELELLQSVLRVHCSVEVVLEGNVEISVVSNVGRDRDGSSDDFSLIDGDGVLEVEDGLFPVRVSGFWPGRKHNRLVTFGELDVEVGDECVNVVVSVGTEFEVGRPSQVLYLHRMNVHTHDLRRTRDNGIGIHSVHKRLQVCLLLDAGHIKPIYIVPNCTKYMATRRNNVSISMKNHCR